MLKVACTIGIDRFFFPRARWGGGGGGVGVVVQQIVDVNSVPAESASPSSKQNVKLVAAGSRTNGANV